MKTILFNADFQRRLVRLYFVLGTYLIEGKDVGIAPALFSAFSSIWSLDSVKLREPKSKDDIVMSISVSDDDFPF